MSYSRPAAVNSTQTMYLNLCCEFVDYLKYENMELQVVAFLLRETPRLRDTVRGVAQQRRFHPNRRWTINYFITIKVASRVLPVVHLYMADQVLSVSVFSSFSVSFFFFVSSKSLSVETSFFRFRDRHLE